jgi:hypothetical protein
MEKKSEISFSMRKEYPGLISGAGSKNSEEGE